MSPYNPLQPLLLYPYLHPYSRRNRRNMIRTNEQTSYVVPPPFSNPPTTNLLWAGSGTCTVLFSLVASKRPCHSLLLTDSPALCLCYWWFCCWFCSETHRFSTRVGQIFSSSRSEVWALHVIQFGILISPTELL